MLQKNNQSVLRVLIAIAVLLILFIPVTSRSTTKAEQTSDEQPLVADEIPKQKTVEEMIQDIAPMFGQDPKLISKISWCESKHEVLPHDGGRAVNVTGIHDTTFKGWLPKYQKERNENLNIDSTYDQLKMMSWAFSKGESYRTQWTTYVAYTNGGTYSFYSRLLKGHYTARCK